MSFQAMTWAVKQELPAMQKIVLLMMSNDADEHGIYTDTVDSIARKCGMHRRSVGNQINELIKTGLLLVKSGKHGRLSNVYKLQLSNSLPEEMAFSPYLKNRVSLGLRMKVYERDNYTCKICGTNKKLSIDHIHPESKGGTNDIENLQTLCVSCNTKKGASL